MRIMQRAIVPATARAVSATAAIAALALAGLGAAGPVAHAAAVPTDVLINEVYGGGGNSGAPFTHDFVELKNTGSDPVRLDGSSLQYAARGGSSFANRMNLSGTVQPGDTFLIRLAGGSGNGVALPGFDAEGGINASGTAGTFALVNSTNQLVCEAAQCQDSPTVIDLVGWGGAATFSGTAPAPGTTNATSVSRTQNTGVNAEDFTAGAPTPQPAGAAPVDPEPTPDPTDPGPVDPGPVDPGARVSIADIQGTGPTSPLEGRTVSTTGIVTAVYPTGGLNGFVLQTGGTGAEPGQGSEALFIYAPSQVGSVNIGDSVEVRGRVSEYFGQTQLTLEGTAIPLTEPLVAVKPLALDALPATETEREALEHMLLDLSGATFTVTDVYTTGNFGEVTLVEGTSPLIQPGQVLAPGPEATAMYADNLARTIKLDDGMSVNLSRNTDMPTSYISQDEPVRVGARAQFTDPVIYAYSREEWRLQPTSPWRSVDTDPVLFENTREATPTDVGGDLQVATFNVLNYFPTLGEDLTGCTSYNDRFGAPISVRGGCLARGAYTQASFERQETKIVNAISASGADVVGLLEIENSARLGHTPDEATATLVAALNAKDGEGTWAFVPTGPTYAEAGQSGGQDAISNAIIYKPAAVRLDGQAQILMNSPAFSNAREPLGQVFVPVQAGTGASGEPFFFVVNHFKSKGSADSYDASLVADPVQGNARTSRQLQADALVAWTSERAAALGVSDVFLGGDFNAYAKETSMQRLYDAKYTNVLATLAPKEWSYVFNGMAGSLDHIVASPGAYSRVTGATDWAINGPESVLLQYSRYQSSASDLYRDDVFASSDHNPLIIGLDARFPDAPVVSIPTDPVTQGGSGGSDPAGGEKSPAAKGMRSSGVLPRTGSELGPYVIAAVLMSAIGVALVARRPRSPEDS